MKTNISDLPPELVSEILSRVLLTSLSKVRSTSKQWNTLSKNQIVCKAEAKNQFLGFMTSGFRVWSVRINLQSDGDGEYDDPSVKQICNLDKGNVSRVFHCNGLVLCIPSLDHNSLVAWNPYLGQTRLIQLRYICNRNKFGLGYDSSCRYKILRFIDYYMVRVKRRILELEIYDFDTDSWKEPYINPDWYISDHSKGVSVKGNMYWIALDKRRTKEGEEDLLDDFLLCFDFTRERFGPRLKLPFRDYFNATGALACVREEQLAVMIRDSHSYKMKIWVTTKIEPEFVSWSEFLVFDMTTREGILFSIQHGSFIIDEEKKVAWLFDYTIPTDDEETPRRRIAYVVGEDGYYKEVDLGESSEIGRPTVCSYVLSLVQIEPKGREKKNLLLSRRV